MNWIILLLAGLFEVSLTFCLGKTRAASGVEFYLWGSGFLASTVLSMALLSKAVQTLPLGTAYAIWTGIGAVGTVLIGIFVFKEPATPIRLFFLFTLIASLIGLKVVSY
ncbi:MAG: multidrug efflux SMR transporter [Sodaliphilus sp.]|nr:multidrug efflux SMR transporter [Sodaliphilus sp.]